MSSFGSQVRKRLEALRKAEAEVPVIIDRVAENATIAAVDAATEATPPNGGASITGVNTRTGSLSQHWTKDSITKPVNGRTELKNDLQYASYVDQGHRVDKHFTSHLALEGGMLVGKPNGDGGLVVGTKTTYVKGLYMVKRATGKYRSEVRRMLDWEIRRALS